MLTVDEMHSLEKGDLVEVAPLLRGVTEEPVVLRVREITPDGLGVTFVSTWHGVTLGKWIAVIEEDEVKWAV